jgi:phosphate starvation-inducible protein PhoH
MNDGENFSGGGDGGNISTKRSSRGRKSAAAQPPQGAQPTKRKNRARLNNQILEEMFNFSYNATGSVCATAAAAAAPFSVPKNKNQKKYMQILQDTSKKIVIATGPAGTGKTLLATEYAVRGFLDGQYNKIIFTRPSVTVDEDLGYLPGTLEEKMAPWMRPIYDILYQFYAVKEVAQMLENKTIEICPLGFMRGRTFKRCCIVADEMQNSTAAQMKMILTRIG